ncbi:hypothetical protein JYU20_03525 [Bacteroidales bacterium AH-315-I05]|nr:hypothetical protein [Bacteroidales bacterium AH-315-I05]
MFLKRFFYYLDPRTLFKKRTDGTEGNLNITFMHGINRITIFIFLICLLVMLVRLLTK